MSGVEDGSEEEGVDEGGETEKERVVKTYERVDGEKRGVYSEKGTEVGSVP